MAVAGKQNLASGRIGCGRLAWSFSGLRCQARLARRPPFRFPLYVFLALVLAALGFLALLFQGPLFVTQPLLFGSLGLRLIALRPGCLLLRLGLALRLAAGTGGLRSSSALPGARALRLAAATAPLLTVAAAIAITAIVAWAALGPRSGSRRLDRAGGEQ